MEIAYRGFIIRRSPFEIRSERYVITFANSGKRFAAAADLREAEQKIDAHHKGEA